MWYNNPNYNIPSSKVSNNEPSCSVISLNSATDTLTSRDHNPNNFNYEFRGANDMNTLTNSLLSNCEKSYSHLKDLAKLESKILNENKPSVDLISITRSELTTDLRFEKSRMFQAQC